MIPPGSHVHFWRRSHYVAGVCLSLEQFFCLSLPREREREVQRRGEEGRQRGIKHQTWLLFLVNAYFCFCLFIWVTCVFKDKFHTRMEMRGSVLVQAAIWWLTDIISSETKWYPLHTFLSPYVLFYTWCAYFVGNWQLYEIVEKV